MIDVLEAKMEIKDFGKIDLSKAAFSLNDIKRNIKLPSHYSETLAYLCGVLAGDGHIDATKKGNYDLYCSGNPYDEKSFYYNVLLPIINNLFNIHVNARNFSSGTFGFRIGSKAIVLFLTKILGIPVNRKYDKLTIPIWVKTNENFVRAYLRGLADADFSFSLKRRYAGIKYYPVISGVSKSEPYMEEIAQALECFGIKISRSFNVTRKDSRFKSGLDITHRVHIYGHAGLIKWMQVIGFWSPKHLCKFELWKTRNIGNNRLKTKQALQAAELIKNTGWANQPVMIAGAGVP